VLLPLCRRRLWPEKRNDGPLRTRVAELSAAIASIPESTVHFG